MPDSAQLREYVQRRFREVQRVEVQPRRAAIHEFYNRRQRRCARLSLHVVQNFRVDVLDEDRARCEYVMSLYAADGEPVLTDGPYVELKEYLGGLDIVDAPDLDAALHWARKLQAVIGLLIEVRPFFNEYT